MSEHAASYQLPPLQALPAEPGSRQRAASTRGHTAGYHKLEPEPVPAVSREGSPEQSKRDGYGPARSWPIRPPEGKTIERGDGRTCKVSFIGIQAELLSLDMKTQSFTMVGLIHMFWYDPDFLTAHPDAPQGAIAEKALPTTYELEDDGVCMPINPKSPFSSQVRHEQPVPSKLLYDPKTALVFYDVSFRATLGARLGLQRFPFDRFTLCVGLKFRKSLYHLSPVPLADVPHKWDLRHITDVRMSQLLADEFVPRARRACVWDCSSSQPVLEVSLERRPEYYTTNIFLPLFLVVLISSTIYAIPAEEVAARATLCVTLLLTQFALKFAYSSDLPTVSYRTLLDTYALAATLLICLNLSVATGISLFASYDEQEVTHIDAVAGVVFAATWMTTHVVLATRASWLYAPWEEAQPSRSERSPHLMELAAVLPGGNALSA